MGINNIDLILVKQAQNSESEIGLPTTCQTAAVLNESSIETMAEDDLIEAFELTDDTETEDSAAANETKGYIDWNLDGAKAEYNAAQTTSSTDTSTSNKASTDEDNEVEITYSDFKKLFSDNYEMDSLLSETGYKKVFEIFDANGDGVIKEDEIERLSFGSALDDITLAEMKKIINDNIVSADETMADEDDEDTVNTLIEKLKETLGNNSSDDTIACTDTAQGTSSAGASGYKYGSSSGSSGTTSSGSVEAALSSTSGDSNEVTLEELEAEKEAREQTLSNAQDALNAVYDESDDEVASAKKEMEDAEGEYDKALAENAQEDPEVKALMEDKEANDKELEANEKAINETNIAISEKEKEIWVQEDTTANLNSELSSLESSLRALKDKVDPDEENADLNAKIESVEKQIQDKKDEIETAEDNLKLLNDELDALQNNGADDEPPGLAGLEEKNKELIEKRNEIETDIAEKANDTVKELLGIYQEKRSEFEDKKASRIEEAKADVEKAETDVEDINQQITDYKNEQTAKENAYNTGDLADMMSNISEYENGVLLDEADYIEQVCNEYGIDQALVMAIMSAETGYGTSSAIIDSNNPGGYMDSATGCQTIKKFDTLEEGIDAVVKNLANNYIGEGLTTISGIGAKYCPVGATNDPTGLNTNWVSNVTSIYNKLTGKNIDSGTSLG